ncbi:hypothetical protein CLOP_g192 [Closterium sp. NIES-67]|nr:hypothetical protein CLOP_g192 [Closterium sp. NIES-67]
MASSEAVLALLRAYRPRFESKPDSVAFAVHATFLASGFRCLAVGPDAAEIAAGSKGSDSSADAGIEGWNATPDVYTFAYAHQTPGDSAEGASADKTAGTVVVQCLSVAEGELLMVDATGMGGTGSEAAGGASAFVSHLEIRVPEYTSADTPPTSADYSKSTLGFRHWYPPSYHPSSSPSPLPPRPMPLVVLVPLLLELVLVHLQHRPAPQAQQEREKGGVQREREGGQEGFILRSLSVVQLVKEGEWGGSYILPCLQGPHTMTCIQEGELASCLPGLASVEEVC